MQSLNDVVALVEPWLVTQALPPDHDNVNHAIEDLQIALTRDDIAQLTLQLQSRLLAYGELTPLSGLIPVMVCN